jgi:hypothetical protein
MPWHRLQWRTQWWRWSICKSSLSNETLIIIGIIV